MLTATVSTIKKLIINVRIVSTTDNRNEQTNFSVLDTGNDNSWIAVEAFPRFEK